LVSENEIKFELSKHFHSDSEKSDDSEGRTLVVYDRASQSVKNTAKRLKSRVRVK
jgi:hypothetical protein